MKTPWKGSRLPFGPALSPEVTAVTTTTHARRARALSQVLWNASPARGQSSRPLQELGAVLRRILQRGRSPLQASSWPQTRSELPARDPDPAHPKAVFFPKARTCPREIINRLDMKKNKTKGNIYLTLGASGALGEMTSPSAVADRTCREATGSRYWK